MMEAKDLNRFLQMSLSLSSERDRESLLSAILDTAMDFAHCDAGTLYLLGEGGLGFCRMVTRSQNVRQGGHDAPITLPPVPIDEKYACAWTAIHNEALNVADVQADGRFNFSGPAQYDAMTGYRTSSMLVVPMTDDKGGLIGVMQLINALDGAGNVVPFDPEMELLISAVASQAAISITNMQYAEKVTRLLDSLVMALSIAIEKLSPYKAGERTDKERYEELLRHLQVENPWKFG